MSTWTDPDRRSTLRDLASRGLTSTQIAAALPFDATPAAVRKACNRYAIDMMPKGWPPRGSRPTTWSDPDSPRRKTLEQHAADGLSATQIAKAMGVTRNTILGACWRHGVKRAEGHPPTRPTRPVADQPPPPPRPLPSAAMLRLARFDPVIARSLRDHYATAS